MSGIMLKEKRMTIFQAIVPPAPAAAARRRENVGAWREALARLLTKF